MKRSEIIRFIAWFLDDQCTESNTESATDLLDHLEARGMLPPPREGEISEEEAPIYGVSPGTFYSEFSWEPEDDS